MLWCSEDVEDGNLEIIVRFWDVGEVFEVVA